MKTQVCTLAKILMLHCWEFFQLFFTQPYENSNDSHIGPEKIALDNSHLSSQVWAAQLDQVVCCHKSCSLLLDQTFLQRKAEIR